jgi:hypothetical protein
LAFLILSTAVHAKAPVLDRFYPPGACRGSEAEVTAAGSFDHWPVRAWVTGSGVSIDTAPDKGKLRFKVEANAAPGLRWVRLYDEEGATALRPFFVGTLPELLEVEPNDDPLHPQRLEETSILINGRLGKNGDVDGFEVWLERGQTLVASMEAHRLLGSPMDAVVQIVSERGFVVAQNDDDHEFDPQLVFQAPASGSYVVRTFAFPATPNSTIAFAGGDAFIYRLTLTTGGFVDHGMPLALERGRTGRVELFGWNLPDRARTIDLCCPESRRATASIGHPLWANTAEVRWVDHAAILEYEPNDREHAQAIALPLAVSGVIDPEADEDVYELSGKRGQTIILRIESRALGFPLDPLLRVLDSAGATVAENDDFGRDRRDAELTFRPGADGRYRVLVRDLNRQGGCRFAYLFTAAEARPDVVLSLKVDQITLKPGKPEKLVVTIDRKNGFDRAINVRALGLPEGLRVAPVTSEPTGDTAKSVTLTLEADDAPAAGSFQIVGEAAGDPPIERLAEAEIPGFKVPTAELWVTVVKDEAKPAKNP